MGKLSTLRAAVVAELKAHAPLASVSILEEKKLDLANEIEQAVAKLGLCCVVLTPVAAVAHPNAPGPVLDPARVVVAVFENVLIHRAAADALSASDAAEEVLQRLHGWTPPGFSAPLVAASRGETLELVPDPELLIYHVNLQTTVALPPKSDPRRIR